MANQTKQMSRKHAFCDFSQNTHPVAVFAFSPERLAPLDPVITPDSLPSAPIPPLLSGILSSLSVPCVPCTGPSCDYLRMPKLMVPYKAKKLLERFVPFHLNPMYLIGDYGSVRTLYVHRSRTGEGYLSGTVRPDGYKAYFMKYQDGNNSGTKWFYCHRLVARHYVHNRRPDIFKEVNHLNLDKLDNYYRNLEWNNRALNMRHAWKNGAMSVRSGKNHWRYGKETSEETRRLQSVTKIGVRHPKFKGYFWVNGVRYESSLGAGRATGICYKQIIKRCKAGSPGYSFEPVNMKHPLIALSVRAGTYGADFKGLPE